MKKYEIVLLINQDVPYQGVSVIAKKIQSLLGDAGKIAHSEYWGLRELAYQIGQNKKARYYMLSVEMEPTVVKSVIDYIRINESVIRHGLYLVDAFDVNGSQMMSYTKNLVESASDSDYKNVFPNHIKPVAN